MKTEIDQFAARCNFPAPGQPFRCGVSGGADSLAMMILAVHVGCDVTAIYVDHGLRADSEKWRVCGCDGQKIRSPVFIGES